METLISTSENVDFYVSCSGNFHNQKHDSAPSINMKS